MENQRWQPRFFTIWSGQALSLFGSALVQFALIWWLTTTTQSATTLALATLMGMLPAVLIGPFLGVVVDRWSRRWIMVIADSAVALASLGLAWLFWSGNVAVWHIYAVLFIRSLAGAAQFPAMQASTALMVPREQLSRIAGLNQTLQGLNSIAAPPVGALAIGLLPMFGVLLIDVFTALCAILPMMFVGVPEPEARPSEQEQPSMLGELRAGFAYVWAWRGLTLLIVLAAFLNLVMVPSGSLQPLLVTTLFGAEVWKLALFQSAFGIGMISGGIILGIWGGFKPRILTTLTGIVGLGVAVMALGLMPSNLFWGAVLAQGILGAMVPIANGPLLAVMQSTVDPKMQGRVFTLVNSVATAITPLGLLVSGPISDMIGVQRWFLLSGIFCAVVGGLGFFSRDIVTLEDGRNPAQPATAAAVAVE